MRVWYALRGPYQAYRWPYQAIRGLFLTRGGLIVIGSQRTLPSLQRACYQALRGANEDSTSPPKGLSGCQRALWSEALSAEGPIRISNDPTSPPEGPMRLSEGPMRLPEGLMRLSEDPVSPQRGLLALLRALWGSQMTTSPPVGPIRLSEGHIRLSEAPSGSQRALLSSLRPQCTLVAGQGWVCISLYRVFFNWKLF